MPTRRVAVLILEGTVSAEPMYVMWSDDAVKKCQQDMKKIVNFVHCALCGRAWYIQAQYCHAKLKGENASTPARCDRHFSRKHDMN